MSDPIKINSSHDIPQKGYVFSLEPLYALARAVSDFIIDLWNSLFGDIQKPKQPETPLTASIHLKKPFGVDREQAAIENTQDNLGDLYKKFEKILASTNPEIIDGPAPEQPLGSCISPSLKTRAAEWVQKLINTEMYNIRLDVPKTKKKPEIIYPDPKLTRAIKRGYPINVMGTAFQRSTDISKVDDTLYDQEVASIKKQLKELVKTHFSCPTLQQAILASCVWDLVHPDIISTVDAELAYEKLIPCDDANKTLEITDGITNSTIHDKRVYVTKYNANHAQITVQRKFRTTATDKAVEISLTFLLDEKGTVSNFDIKIKG